MDENVKNNYSSMSELDTKGQTIELDYSNPDHFKIVLDSFGGEEVLKKYQKLSKIILDTKEASNKYSNSKKSILANKINSFQTMNLYTSPIGFEGMNNTIKYSRSKSFPISSNNNYVINSNIINPNATTGIYTAIIEKIDMATGKYVKIANTQHALTHDNLLNSITLSPYTYITLSKKFTLYKTSSILTLFNSGTSKTYYSNRIVKRVRGEDDFVKEIRINKPSVAPNSDNALVTYNRNDPNACESFNNSIEGKNVKVMLTIEGYIQFSGIVDEIVGLSYEATSPEDIVLHYDQKGSVSYNQSFQELSKCFKIDNTKKRIDFTIGPDWNTSIDFKGIHGTDGQEITNNAVVKLHCPLTFNTKIKLDNQIVENPITIIIDSVEGQASKGFSQDATICFIPCIKFWWGCFAKYTKLRMLDSTEKCADEIQVGDLVISGSGKSVKITNIVTGPEEYLMRIEMDDGNTLDVTNNHAISTTKGMISAEDIKSNDFILTPDGNNSKVKFAYPILYNDKVYNFETDSEDNTLIANGLVTGDYVAQNTIRTSLHSKKIELEPDTKELYAEIVTLVDELKE